MQKKFDRFWGRFFPNSSSYRGLQPRIAQVCTGAGAWSGSTRFRRRFQRRVARLGFKRVEEKVPETIWEALVQSHVRFKKVAQVRGRFRRRVRTRSGIRKR